jgi:hypothetical protein
MSQSTMTGARAIVKVDGRAVGVFDSCQYGANIGNEPVHTLGRYSSNEIAITSYEAIQVGCSGFRVINNGVHTLPKAPKLQDLLNFTRVQLVIEDRQTAKIIMKVENCVPTSWSEAQNAKGTTKFNITYTGTVLSDETDTQVEERSATNLP